MSHKISDDASVVQLVDTLLSRAIARGASDIHLESTDIHLRVRYRIDGILQDQATIPAKYMLQVASRIKVLANIDIAQSRVPQDGKFRLDKQKAHIDFRVSTFPAIHGEKIVIRILDRSRTNPALDELGLSDTMLATFQQLIGRAQGFFLVTGPTGSGKTTTLYAVLNTLNTPEKNIITLEDPVEYTLAGITQGQIHPDAGFTFEKGIRALLRQDPDIVMVGEIRDRQTAQIAIEAALTGHLVLSTLHTNDTTSAVMRLMDMGIEPFLINTAVNGVLAQRLVRKNCTDCSAEHTPTEPEQAFLKKHKNPRKKIVKGAGCGSCDNIGLQGRIGIFELLPVTNALRAKIVEQPDFDALQAQASADGMRPLVEDGLEKVESGIISVAELMRVAM